MKISNQGVRLFLLILTYIVCNCESQVPVVVSLNKSIDHEESSLYIECDYDFTSFGTNLAYLVWSDGQSREFFQYFHYGQGIVIDPEYDARLSDYGDISNSSHSIIIVDANWCDAGTFRCGVADDDEISNPGYGEGELIAITRDPDISYSVVDESGNLNNNDTFPPSTRLQVKCSALWNKNFSVSLTLKDSNLTNTSYGEQREDTCTHDATVVTTISLESEQTYECAADYDGVIKTAEITFYVTTGEIDDQCEGLCGGEIAGIVIGSIAFLAIVGLLIWYCYKKRGNKGATDFQSSNTPMIAIENPFNDIGNSPTENGGPLDGVNNVSYVDGKTTTHTENIKSKTDKPLTESKNQ